MTLVLPSTRAFHLGRRVSSIPSGTPTAMASSIEIPTSQRCSAVRVATSRLWLRRKFKSQNPSILKHPLPSPEDVHIRLHRVIGRLEKFTTVVDPAQPACFHQSDAVAQQQGFAD